MRIRVLALCLMGLWATGWLSGCTVVGDCGVSEREYCVDGDCVCGKACTRQASCDADQLCLPYALASAHGVCADRAFAETHEVLGINSLNGESCTTAKHCRSELCVRSGEASGVCSQECSGQDDCQLYGGECSAGTFEVEALTQSVRLCLDSCVEDGDCPAGTRCAQDPQGSSTLCLPEG